MAESYERPERDESDAIRERGSAAHERSSPNSERGSARHDDGAEALLRQALIDETSAVTVSLKIGGLPVSDTVTAIFYARRDLGTLQTYLTPGACGAGTRIATRSLMRVPCDLDLAEAEDREQAQQLYGEQARALRDVLLAADIVLGIWREAIAARGTRVITDRSVQAAPPLLAPRLLPTALRAPDSQLYVTPVCSARTLADGQPPAGIACVQQDHARIFALTDDPDESVSEFFDSAAEHAQALAVRLAHQEASVERFLELSDAA